MRAEAQDGREKKIKPTKIKLYRKASEGAQWVKVPGAKPDDQRVVSKAHVVEGKNQLPKNVL